MDSEDIPLRRRSILAGSAAALAGRTALTDTVTANETAATTREGRIAPMEFFSPVSLLNANEEPLTDEDLVAVWAEPTARNELPTVKRNNDSAEPITREPGVKYPEETRIPVVAVDNRNNGLVAGTGGLLAIDGTSWAQGNEEFLRNLLDEMTGRAGGTDQTVLFHEYTNREKRERPLAAERQPWRLEDYSRFVEYAGEYGYEFVSDQRDEFRTPGTPRFVTAVRRTDPDVVMIVTPDRFNEAELRVLERYVENGGNVLLVGSGDLATMPPKEAIGFYPEDAETVSQLPVNEEVERADSGEGNPSQFLNEIAARLSVGFRFNADRVLDSVSRQGSADGIPLTADFNTDRYPALFEDADGLTPDDIQYGYRGLVTYVADGDTFRINLQNGVEVEVRLLGFDTTESSDNGCFERPVEWEGLAYDKEFDITDLRFDATRSLVRQGSEPLAAGDDAVAVRAESTATSTDAGGDGQYAPYEGTAPALVAAADGVVAAGSLLVTDAGDLVEDGVPRRNYDFVQNVWDAHLAGSGTVLYDESHGQPYTLNGDFSTFRDEVSATYTVEATDDLLADLERAEAVWLTPATESFGGEELARLQQFVRDGGAVFVHASAGDPITHLNDVLDRLRTGLQVNDDQVTDAESNAGQATSPITGAFPTFPAGDTTRYPYFIRRLSEAGTYQNECGKPNYDYLESWSTKAKNFLADKVADEEVELRLDPNGSVYDGLGRVLAYTYYDSNGDGAFDSNVNRELVENGYARVYDSGHSKHESFLEAEIDAQEDGQGIWLTMDAEDAPEVRNRPVEEVFVPQAASVRTDRGRLPGRRAPVFAERTASQRGEPGVEYQRVPLVGVDDETGVALVGGPICEETYEMQEDPYRALNFVKDQDPIRVNTSAFDNYTFLLNLIDWLADDELDGGDVLVDGGHGQFGSPTDRFGGGWGQSADDAAYFQRFLEGVGLRMRGVNNIQRWLEDDRLDPRALIVTTPMDAFSEEELAAVRAFADEGGAVVLMGSGRASAEARERLNEVAAGLETDLRLNGDRVTDPEHTFRGIANFPRTSNLNPSFDLFDRVTPDDDGGSGPDADLTVTGSRSDRGTEPPESSRVYTAGEDVIVEITVEQVNRPVTIRDDVDDAVTKHWGVYEDRGDVTGVDEVRGIIRLGRVRPEEVAGDATVTKRYVVEAPAIDEVPEDPVVTCSPAPEAAGESYCVPAGSAVGDDERDFLQGIYASPVFGPSEAIDTANGEVVAFTGEDRNFAAGGVDRNEQSPPDTNTGTDVTDGSNAPE